MGTTLPTTTLRLQETAIFQRATLTLIHGVIFGVLTSSKVASATEDGEETIAVCDSVHEETTQRRNARTNRATISSTLRARICKLQRSSSSTSDLPTYSATASAANSATLSPPYMKAASHSIQTALESLPNFAIPQLEVTTTDDIPKFSSDTKCTTTPESCTGKK